MREPTIDMTTESQPLLQQEHNSAHNLTSNWLQRPQDALSAQSSRHRTRQALNSKYGHYFVIFLVSVDILGIFCDFLISLYLCEHECCQNKDEYRNYHEAQRVLGIVSLVFSSLFMVELMVSIWAFGFQ